MHMRHSVRNKLVVAWLALDALAAASFSDRACCSAAFFAAAAASFSAFAWSDAAFLAAAS